MNGAGKTSTFKMITGDEYIPKGEAYLNKISIKSDIKQVNIRKIRKKKRQFILFIDFRNLFCCRNNSVSEATRLLPSIRSAHRSNDRPGNNGHVCET